MRDGIDEDDDDENNEDDDNGNNRGVIADYANAESKFAKEAIKKL